MDDDRIYRMLSSADEELIKLGATILLSKDVEYLRQFCATYNGIEWIHDRKGLYKDGDYEDYMDSWNTRSYLINLCTSSEKEIIVYNQDKTALIYRYANMIVHFKV